MDYLKLGIFIGLVVFGALGWSWTLGPLAFVDQITQFELVKKWSNPGGLPFMKTTSILAWGVALFIAWGGFKRSN